MIGREGCVIGREGCVHVWRLRDALCEREEVCVCEEGVCV